MSFGEILFIYIAARIGIHNIRKYVTRPLRLKMELIKYSNTDMVKVIDLPDDLTNDVDEEAIIKNPIYQKTFEAFGSKIVTLVDRKDLDNFYRNFVNLDEEKISFLKRINFVLTGIGGIYNPNDNKIILETSLISRFMNSIVHELLHVSSTYHDKENEVVYCGFSQQYIRKDKNKKKKYETYGLGINEGYTQYFATKYLNNNYNIIKSIYVEEQEIIKIIEMVVGEEKLKSLYFRADLNGLVKELEKYTTRDEIYKFINYTDVLCARSTDKTLNFKKLNEVKEYINSFLVNLYNNAVLSGDIEKTIDIKGPYVLKSKK